MCNLKVAPAYVKMVNNNIRILIVAIMSFVLHSIQKSKYIHIDVLFPHT